MRLWDLTSIRPEVVASLHVGFEIQGAYVDRGSGER